VTVPAGDVAPLRLWFAASGQEPWFWQEPCAQTAKAAVGDANTVRGERLNARHVLRTSLHAVHQSMAGPPAPRLVGGMSFDAEGPVNAGNGGSLGAGALGALSDASRSRSKFLSLIAVNLNGDGPYLRFPTASTE